MLAFTPLEQMSEGPMRAELSQLQVVIHLTPEGSLRRKEIASRVAALKRELRAFEDTPRYAYAFDAEGEPRSRAIREDEPTRPFIPGRRPA